MQLPAGVEKFRPGPKPMLSETEKKVARNRRVKECRERKKIDEDWQSEFRRKQRVKILIRNPQPVRRMEDEFATKSDSAMYSFLSYMELLPGIGKPAAMLYVSH